MMYEKIIIIFIAAFGVILLFFRGSSKRTGSRPNSDELRQFNESVRRERESIDKLEELKRADIDKLRSNNINSRKEVDNINNILKQARERDTTEKG